MSTIMSDVSTPVSADVLESVRGTRDAMTIQRVFGDPIELEGVTVIPVARIAGGAGGGGGESKEGDDPGSGYGSGFGMDARGIGVYEVRDGGVVWKPAVDVTRLARGGQVLAAIGVVCAALVLMVRRRR